MLATRMLATREPAHHRPYCSCINAAGLRRTNILFLPRVYGALAVRKQADGGLDVIWVEVDQVAFIVIILEHHGWVVGLQEGACSRSQPHAF